ncbi:MAG: efflux RND transporter periplasmic adaptor subunit [Geobacteraceae bacterium]|nr:efflux RND transporter periplasmic adaptor subunit [Geobacteraceae bacterium]NTW80272.1 efflux RND transporter periplasmic adaptor subunit [Geobacteraceae bacterium]
MTDSTKAEPKVPANDITQTLGLDRQTTLSVRLKPYLLRGAALLLVAIVALLVWKKRAADSQVSYQTQEVSRGSLTITVSATGTLQPNNQVDVGSEISGTFKTVEVNYNDRIKRGQVLGRIDTAKQEALVKQTVASLEAARAKVLQAHATVSEAKAKLARLVQVQEASGGKVPSKSEMESARATLERAIADEANTKATVIQAEASLEAQRIDLSKSVLRSPINGIVLKRAVEPGQTVAASLQTSVLFTLAEDLTKMELQVDVDEADVGKVQPGQNATFTVSAYPDRTFPAVVSQVRFGSKTVAGVVTYTTVLKVNNADLLLRPGMTGTAGITVQKVDNAMLVPNTALRFSPPAAPVVKQSSGSLIGKLMPRPPSSAPKPQESATDKQQHIWTLTTGQLQKITVTTGMTDGVKTEVKADTLEPGMPVVVDLAEVKK